MVPQPTPCHMPEAMYSVRNHSGRLINVIDVPPNHSMARLMMPSIAVMFFSKPIMITVEIKCGKYDMVCTTFLNG